MQDEINMTYRFVFDEITYFGPGDTSKKLQADIAFIKMLADRCEGKSLVLRNLGGRVWVHKNELRRLRHIANMGMSKTKNKNRRLNIDTLRTYLAKAEDELAERAGKLAAVALQVEHRPNIDDFVDVIDWKTTAYQEHRKIWARL